MSTPSSNPVRRRALLIGIGVAALVGALILGALLVDGRRSSDDRSEPPARTHETPLAPRTTAVTSTPTRVPAGTATRITITNPDGTQVAAAPLEAFPASRGLAFSPDEGKAAWWEQGRYGAPAVAQQSVISAHSTFDGQPDVFNRLHAAQVGAEVRIDFSGGDVARYRVTEIADAPKSDVVDDSTPVGARVWDDPGLSVVTCDLESGKRPDGHLRGNTVLFTERTA